MKEEIIDQNKNNENIKKQDNFNNIDIKTHDANNKNDIKNIKIQISENNEKNLLYNNFDNKFNRSIMINLPKNDNENNTINKNNKIYKKRFPINEYFNHDNNIKENEIYKNIYPINEQLFLNHLKYYPKMNQLNYFNNNYNIPNQKYPNIITNNNNY